MADALVQALIENIYGPQKDAIKESVGYPPETTVFLKAPKISRTAIDKGLKSVVPQDTYHPKVCVAIDFTHQFTTSISNIEGKRPLDFSVLQAETRRIFYFTQRYFEYIKSYGSPSESASYFSEHFAMPPTDEKGILVFLNATLNNFLTSINVSRSRKEIGTATVTFKDIKNPFRNGRGNHRIFFDAAFGMLDQLMVPMLPITIWGRGRLYKNWYFPIFDGYIVSTSPKDANGFVEYDIMCKDVLELARISTEMINPALIQLAEKKNVNAVNMLVKPFYGHDHFEIVKSMFLGGRLKFDPQDRSIKADAGATREPATMDIDTLPLSKLENFDEATDETITGVKKLITELDMTAIHKNKFTFDAMVNYVSHRTRTRKFIAWGDKITPYRIWTIQSPRTFTSTFSNRLDIISEVSKMTYYDFFVDGCGNVHYHPMRLINNYLVSNACCSFTSDLKYWHNRVFPHVQVINQEETFQSTSVLNLEELITFLRVSGEDETIQGGDSSQLIGLYGSSTDKKMLARYGYRRQEVQNNLFNMNVEIVKGKVSFLDVAAAVLMQFMNAELFTRQTVVAFRPELEIASPVFFTEDNSVFYINSVDHNITVGGDATTSINCSFGRKDYELPPDLNSFLLQTQVAYNLKEKRFADPKTLWNNIKIKEWQRYLDISDEDIKNIGLQKAKEPEYRETNNEMIPML